MRLVPLCKGRSYIRVTLLLLILVGMITVFYTQRDLLAHSSTNTPATSAANPRFSPFPSSPYVYYTIKQTSGFILARAPKGANGQPLGVPRPVAQFRDDFGLAESDAVLSMQLSPDGRFLAINATRDHGEQVWMFDTQRMTLNLTPQFVLGNFLHWLPGATSHIFLYRPMFPMSPEAPMDGNGWNPGLWEVDAATGAHRNIDIHVPSAYLVDAVPSPDGTHILYATSAGLGIGSDTWMMHGDGSELTHLFNIPGGAQSIAGLFSWSPDATTIAYERLSDSPTPFLAASLWIMNNRGGLQRRLAETDGGHGFVPAWSPDGRRIAYIVRTNLGDHRADLSMQALQSAIAIVDVTTGKSSLVAASTQTGMQINLNPQWSSDGESITFTAFNPMNRVLGGTPRYWSVLVGEEVKKRRPQVVPLTPEILHVVAVGE